jgi:hypothetical protein
MRKPIGPPTEQELAGMSEEEKAAFIKERTKQDLFRVLGS